MAKSKVPLNPIFPAPENIVRSPVPRYTLEQDKRMGAFSTSPRKRVRLVVNNEWDDVVPVFVPPSYSGIVRLGILPPDPRVLYKDSATVKIPKRMVPRPDLAVYNREERWLPEEYNVDPYRHPSVGHEFVDEKKLVRMRNYKTGTKKAFKRLVNH